ncbi:27613_t:CDS:1, partial [Racocetra persica]
IRSNNLNQVHTDTEPQLQTNHIAAVASNNIPLDRQAAAVLNTNPLIHKTYSAIIK